MATGSTDKIKSKRDSFIVEEITTEIVGPVESFAFEEPWDWPNWPKGPVGAAQTGMQGIKSGRLAGNEGLNPMWGSFATARGLIQQMRDAPPEGKGQPVYSTKVIVTDEGEMTKNIKATARYLGADLVGIVKLTPERIKLGAYRKDQEEVAKYTHYIILASEMNSYRFRTRLRHPNFSRPARAPSASSDVHKAYSDVERICIHLADYIRGMGYEAESEGPSRRILNGPFANWAGLGETGRHNTVITPEFGPRVRLGGVLTTLPMVEDKPIDIGVQAFCETCMKCIKACPMAALSKGEKQLIRGVMRWPHNRKRCSELGWAHGGDVSYGCQQCLIVCPYNKPPGMMHDTVRWLLRHAPWMNDLILKMDDLLPSEYQQYMDYQDVEKGEKATLGMWPELWHEKGRADDYVPPPRPDMRPGQDPGIPPVSGGKEDPGGE